MRVADEDEWRSSRFPQHLKTDCRVHMLDAGQQHVEQLSRGKRRKRANKLLDDKTVVCEISRQRGEIARRAHLVVPVGADHRQEQLWGRLNKRIEVTF